jgi:hypothetical protein
VAVLAIRNTLFTRAFSINVFKKAILRIECVEVNVPLLLEDLFKIEVVVFLRALICKAEFSELKISALFYAGLQVDLIELIGITF